MSWSELYVYITDNKYYSVLINFSVSIHLETLLPYIVRQI